MTLGDPDYPLRGLGLPTCRAGMGVDETTCLVLTAQTSRVLVWPLERAQGGSGAAERADGRAVVRAATVGAGGGAQPAGGASRQRGPPADLQSGCRGARAQYGRG